MLHGAANSDSLSQRVDIKGLGGTVDTSAAFHATALCAWKNRYTSGISSSSTSVVLYALPTSSRTSHSTFQLKRRGNLVAAWLSRNSNLPLRKSMEENFQKNVKKCKIWWRKKIRIRDIWHKWNPAYVKVEFGHIAVSSAWSSTSLIIRMGGSAATVVFVKAQNSRKRQLPLHCLRHNTKPVEPALEAADGGFPTYIFFELLPIITDAGYCFSPILYYMFPTCL